MKKDINSTLFIYTLISERQKIFKSQATRMEEIVFNTQHHKEGAAKINVGLLYCKFGGGKTLTKPKAFYHSVERVSF